MNKKILEQARLAGYTARQAGKGKYDGPTYEIGFAGKLLRDEWLMGWEEADAERRRKKA